LLGLNGGGAAATVPPGGSGHQRSLWLDSHWQDIVKMSLHVFQ